MSAKFYGKTDYLDLGFGVWMFGHTVGDRLICVFLFVTILPKRIYKNNAPHVALLYRIICFF